MPAFDFITTGQQVIATEQAALETLKPFINQNFQQACQLILDCSSRVVVMGMGKSGHIGNKIAATLASTGTPAFFVHPAEASHGDLGMITPQDVIIAISNSGEAHEILSILPVIKRLHIKLISITANGQSSMAQFADVSLEIGKSVEACPLGLAPTSSTTATLVLGDALAVALLAARGFTAEDFALSHPGGALGRKLLLRVSDLMHSGELLPVVQESTLIKDALLEISRKGLGMTAVVNAQGQLTGIYTDGDLRRTLDLELNIRTTPIVQVMTKNPKTILPQLLAAEAVALMEEKKINGVIVVDEHLHPVGALNMHDLLKAGVV
ncbi:MAG: KpsF/GutQ family sugar-phosphate isomerase [Moraxellaceae bacterium]|jgi:arabinose-5-phosphate isomerase|nr:KpsF/GutQ family sugar-phosphate isomerase [Moraxellaceae bacterium]MBK8327104.1 KpsF/GutQ family sugar-phosphate isomerase [Moraxellaceae bacterium]MBL0229618.1 KpsF/GutQ family sugar-phosphate isomerase [Moraxellaceae bacterium]